MSSTSKRGTLKGRRVAIGSGEIPPALESKIFFDTNSSCWYWIGYINDQGYGISSYLVGDNKRRSIRAHRILYEIHKGPIPEGLVIDHLCRNRCCVNPNHLEAVRQYVNIARTDAWEKCKAKKAAITHCPRGHEYAGDNLIYKMRSDGRYSIRLCRSCARLRARYNYRKKHPEIKVVRSRKFNVNEKWRDEE